VGLTIRRATADDAAAVAEVFIPSFRTLSFLPELHTPEEDRGFFRDVVLPQREVWVAADDECGHVLGFIALSEDMLDHLYVHPDAQRRGVGAWPARGGPSRRRAGFTLWVFQQNTGARAFYENHGLVAVRFTDGQDSDEKTPDVLYAWRPDA
jgi:GNAT superfamily N-acetyltransferase